MKKFLAILLSAIMAVGILAGCNGGSSSSNTDSANTSKSSSTADSLEGAYVFMMKISGSVFYDHMWDGFEAAIKATDPDAVIVNRSPSERGVTYQVTAMEECLTQKIGALCLATFAEAGFDEINQKYEAADIPIFSADSRVSDQYRITHFNQTSSVELGRYYLWTSIIASQRVDITDDMNNPAGIEAEAKRIVNEHTGDPILVGLISATPDSPVQLGWHYAINDELDLDIYQGKVEQEIKYGMDEQAEAANQLNAFLTEAKVDVVCCMSGFGETVAQSAYDSGNEMKIPVVGLGLCSNAYDKYPDVDQDTYGSDVIMPWSMLWDLELQGYVAGAGMALYVAGEWDGSLGSTFTSPAVGRFTAEPYTVVECPADEGTEVVCGSPVIFTKYNKDIWKDRV